MCEEGRGHGSSVHSHLMPFETLKAKQLGKNTNCTMALFFFLFLVVWLLGQIRIRKWKLDLDVSPRSSS